MKKIKKFYPLLVVLGISSSYGANATIPSVQSKIFNSAQLQNVLRIINAGTSSFVTRSKKGDVMTQTTVSYETLEMEAPTTYANPVRGRTINIAVDIFVNPNKIPHQVDWLGLRVPSDCPRLNSFGLSFDFGKNLDEWNGILTTSCDELFDDPDKSSHTGLSIPSFYDTSIIGKKESTIKGTFGNPQYFQFPFYTKSKSTSSYLVPFPINSDPDEENSNMVVTCSRTSSNYTADWFFNWFDKVDDSSPEAEANRMYAKYIEEGFRRQNPAHPAPNTLRFFYSLSLGNVDYPPSVLLKVNTVSSVGYGVMGSSIETNKNESASIKMLL